MRAYGVWCVEAKCRLIPEVRAEFLSESRRAKENCFNCPVKSECLEYAILYNEHGVWGGTTEIERNRVRASSPHLSLILRQEALRLGILEHRYSIVQYWETIQKARSMGEKPRQYFDRGYTPPELDVPSLTLDPELVAEESSEPPEELNTQSEFECEPIDFQEYAAGSM